MRMGVGPGQITDGRKVNAGNYRIFETFLMVFFFNEGDKWAYSFDVVHDVPGLIQHRGGNVKFIQSLDDHFNGGHNDQTNEVRKIYNFDQISNLNALTCLLFLYHHRFVLVNDISRPTISLTCIPSLERPINLKRRSGRLHDRIITIRRLDYLVSVLFFFFV